MLTFDVSAFYLYYTVKIIANLIAEYMNPVKVTIFILVNQKRGEIPSLEKLMIDGAPISDGDEHHVYWLRHILRLCDPQSCHDARLLESQYDHLI